MPVFRVTQTNEAEVRAYLDRLVVDRSRLVKAIHWRSDPAAASQEYAEAATHRALSQWIERHLSSKGRTRMLTAFRQQRRTKDRANWRIPKSLFEQVKRASQAAGYPSPEAWLATCLPETESKRRKAHP